MCNRQQQFGFQTEDKSKFSTNSMYREMCFQKEHYVTGCQFNSVIQFMKGIHFIDTNV